MERPVRRRARLLLVSVAVAGLAGCSSPADIARAGAISDVRANAGRLHGNLASLPRGLSGPQLLEEVRARLPAPLFRAMASGDGVVAHGTITARREAGGGLSYENFIARLCLRVNVLPETGASNVVDEPCDAHDLANTEADETVRLTD